MEYIELKSGIEPFEEGSEILTALLADIGFESFRNQKHNVFAYIPKEKFQAKSVQNIIDQLNQHFKVAYSFEIIADKNWNEEWEKNYPAVTIGDDVYIRAPFHPKKEQYPYEIVIEPKMSFGTAHHPTTAQIIGMMGNENFHDKVVMDMGCGTGVFAIYAEKLGAQHIDAVDNDEWAYENSLENVKRNNCKAINVYLNDADFLSPEHQNQYDIFIANINRNILLRDLAIYEKAIKPGGLLFMSGFYLQDLEILDQEAQKYGLILTDHKVDQEWTAAKWIKA